MERQSKREDNTSYESTEESQSEENKRNMVMRNLVFISYSRKDARWLEMLKTHLKPFERAGVINRWDDTKIEPGAAMEARN